MRSTSLLFISSLLLLSSTPSCLESGNGTPITRQEFDADRAWQDLEYLVDLGPRRMDTPQSAATRSYIRKELEPLGWEFEELPFPVSPPQGAQRKGNLTGVNLIARRPGTEKGELWFCSHYDTYDLPRFVGANDSGSSTAMLMEMARQWAGPKPREGMSLVLCWFDGEEPFHPLPWDDHNNSTFGSRWLSEKMQADGSLKEIRCLVLLDMVADRQLGVSIESMSSGWIRGIFEKTAAGLGHKQLFVDRREIKDDHLPFLRKGVPAADLIDFRFGPGNSWWHTREDTLDKCSAKSMKILGETVLTALPLLEEAARARR